jgi:hypothetical protein
MSKWAKMPGSTEKSQRARDPFLDGACHRPSQPRTISIDNNFLLIGKKSMTLGTGFFI